MAPREKAALYKGRPTSPGPPTLRHQPAIPRTTLAYLIVKLGPWREHVSEASLLSLADVTPQLCFRAKHAPEKLDQNQGGKNFAEKHLELFRAGGTCRSGSSSRLRTQPGGEDAMANATVATG